MNPRWLALLAAGCNAEHPSTPGADADTDTDTDTDSDTDVDDGIDLTGTWTGPCDQVGDLDTGGWPLHSDWTFDLVDDRGDLGGRAGALWIHGSRSGLHLGFRLTSSETDTGSLDEEYFDLQVDDALEVMTGELASYVTGPTYACTFTRSR